MDHEDHDSQLWHLKHPIKGSWSTWYPRLRRRGPEPMLGERRGSTRHIARYKELVGKSGGSPLVEREIAIISDNFVDPAVWDGRVKVTPGTTRSG